MQNDDKPKDEYDREFISLITDIQKRTAPLPKHDRIRMESWCQKLCQVTNNIEWKKNRNLHAISLLDMILNQRFEEPYNKFAPEGSIPILSKTIVKSRLSQKFWRNSERIYASNQSKSGMELQGYDESLSLKAKEPQKDTSVIQKHYPPQTKQAASDLNTPNVPASELDKMKELIEKLKNDLEKKDWIIHSQKDEKARLGRKVDELEKMLGSFLAMENPKK